jgi:hypothetical protein
MFYHGILFFSQIRIWIIVERAQLLPLNSLQVLIRCANPSIWYGLTHKFVTTLLEHTPHVVLHVFTLQAESSLQFQNQALAKSGVSGINFFKKDDQKAYPEVAPHCPISGYIRCVRCKSVVVPASGRRGGAIALSDLARVVHTNKVT